ncbi:MAG: adenylate/guanylate cyclase domain-containing protein [Pseudomonadota bacterium]|nr:adenylate/guanylate cyclase domain-containing protein [Pseudomonadota bacterium]
MERKLSTILAADVVGFSRMMAVDEVNTLEILKNRRFIIDRSINEHGGKIFGSAGDSVIAEFDSPVKATECGVQFQSKMQALNDDIAEDQKMVFRAGIHIGDVMVEEENLFGDAVNIASRLEAEATPGGICLSKTVVDIVGGKLKVSFEDVGELKLKNIKNPIEAFFVVPSKGATRWVHDNTEGPRVKIQKAEPGSLAVMLFKNLSKDEEQDYFCEGFSEDLISVLSQFRKLVVLSGNASFSYRDSNKKPKEIGEELGVRYILEGSVRKLGPKVRISSNLIFTESGKTVWSNKFDTTIDEIFDVQDDLVETIVSTLVGRVEADTIQQLTTVRPDNLGAYETILQGLEYHKKSGITKRNAEKAFELFEQAVQIDPNYARAHAWKACSLANLSDWRGNIMEVLPDCLSSVTRALEIDPNDPEAHRIMGAVVLMQEDFDQASYHHERARDLCPSDPYMIMRYATLLISLGDSEKALEEILRAKRLDPFCPDMLFEDEGMCYFWLDRLPEAIETFNKLQIPTRNSLFYLAATHNRSGDSKEASRVLKEAISMSGQNIEQFVGTQKYKNPGQKEDLLNSLSEIAA